MSACVLCVWPMSCARVGRDQSRQTQAIRQGDREKRDPKLQTALSHDNHNRLSKPAAQSTDARKALRGRKNTDRT